MVKKRSPASFFKNRHGSIAVEFALILPVLFLVYLTIAEMAELFLLQRQLNVAAEAGAELIDAGGKNTPNEEDIREAAIAAFGPRDDERFSVEVTCLDDNRRNYLDDTRIATVEVGYTVTPLASFSFGTDIILKAKSFRLTDNRSLCRTD